MYAREFYEITKHDLGFNPADLLHLKPLTQATLDTLGEIVTVKCTFGDVRIPRKLAVIILYYRDKELEECLLNHMPDKDKYESQASLIRDKYNSILMYYDDICEVPDN